MNFGSTPADSGTFTVTHASFAGLTYAHAFFMSSDSTGDNNATAHEMASTLMNLGCDAPVGNDIVVHATAMWYLTGTMKIRVLAY